MLGLITKVGVGSRLVVGGARAANHLSVLCAGLSCGTLLPSDCAVCVWVWCSVVQLWRCHCGVWWRSVGPYSVVGEEC